MDWPPVSASQTQGAGQLLQPAARALPPELCQRWHPLLLSSTHIQCAHLGMNETLYLSLSLFAGELSNHDVCNTSEIKTETAITILEGRTTPTYSPHSSDLTHCCLTLANSKQNHRNLIFIVVRRSLAFLLGLRKYHWASHIVWYKASTHCDVVGYELNWYFI